MPNLQNSIKSLIKHQERYSQLAGYFAHFRATAADQLERQPAHLRDLGVIENPLTPGALAVLFAGREIEFVFDAVMQDGVLMGRLTVNLVKRTAEPTFVKVAVLWFKGTGEMDIVDEANGNDPIYLHAGNGPLTVVFAMVERSLLL